MKKNEIKKIIEQFIEEETYWHDDHLCIKGVGDKDIIDQFLEKLFCSHEKRNKKYCLLCFKEL